MGNCTRKFLVDIAKSAVGQNSHYIAMPELRRKRSHDCIGICKNVRRCPGLIQSGDELLRN